MTAADATPAGVGVTPLPPVGVVRPRARSAGPIDADVAVADLIAELVGAGFEVFPPVSVPGAPPVVTLCHLPSGPPLRLRYDAAVGCWAWRWPAGVADVGGSVEFCWPADVVGFLSMVLGVNHVGR